MNSEITQGGNIYKVFPHIDMGEQTLGTAYLTYGCLIL